MDVSSVGSLSSTLLSAKTGDAVALSVLKKSLAIQAQGAIQLISALPQTPALQSGGSLANNVNTFA